MNPFPLDLGGDPQGPTIMPPAVFQLSGGFLPDMDRSILERVDACIRQAEAEPAFEALALCPGAVERAGLPAGARCLLDYLLCDHPLTAGEALAHLLRLGSPGLRRSLILILGAMGTEPARGVLAQFAARDPLEDPPGQFPLRLLAGAEPGRAGG